MGRRWVGCKRGREVVFKEEVERGGSDTGRGEEGERVGQEGGERGKSRKNIGRVMNRGREK